MILSINRFDNDIELSVSTATKNMQVSTGRPRGKEYRELGVAYNDKEADVVH